MGECKSIQRYEHGSSPRLTFGWFLLCINFSILCCSFLASAFMTRFSLLAALLVLALPSFAQENGAAASLGSTLGHDGLTLLNAAEFIAVRPLHWEGSDWLMAGGIVSGTALSSIEDRQFQDIADRSQTSGNDRFADVVVVYGNSAYLFPVSAGLYLTGLFTHERWLRETALLATGAMFFSGVLSTAAKIGIGRARPFTGHNNHWFQPFRFFDDNVHSLPSGHTVLAFAMSTVLSRRIHNFWVSAGLYALAASTAASRIYTSEHWLSDVIFGAASATALSNTLVTWFEGGTMGEQSSFRILPYGNGISLVIVL